MIRHQFGQVEYASEHWFRLAATTLAEPHPRRRAGDAGEADAPRTSATSTSSRSATTSRASSSSSARAASSRSLVTLASRRDQADLASVGGLPQRPPPGPPPTRRRRSSAGSTRPPHGRPVTRVGERVVRRLHEFDRAADRGGVQRRPAQRDGRARVRAQREAPPRVRGAREPRLSRPSSSAASPASGTVRVFIGSENPAEDMARRLARPRPVRAAGPRRRRGRRPRADAHGVSAGDRHGPLRIRAHERARSTTSTPDHDARGPGSSIRHRKTRAEERIEELDVSPGGARRRRPSRTVTPPSATTRVAKADEYLAALQRERAEFRTSSAARPRSASATPAWRARTSSARSSSSPTTSTSRSTTRRRASRATPGSTASPRSTASCACSSRARA